jgi:hypothetical protein
MEGMDNSDSALSAAARARILVAKADIAARMAEHGLREKDGWRVLEELRSTATGTQFVFRPIHTRLDAPEIEATVTIDSNGCPE